MYNSTLPLTSAPDGGGWSTPRPGRFTAGKDRAGLDGWGKSRPHRDSIPGPSSRRLSHPGPHHIMGKALFIGHQ